MQSARIRSSGGGNLSPETEAEFGSSSGDTPVAGFNGGNPSESSASLSAAKELPARNGDRSVAATGEIITCPSCGEGALLLATACPHCGFYKGRKVFEVHRHDHGAEG